jgi:2-keto-4-pentenoate hydratase/2-oxohepta-3-ene-1,7-dioic acid hydratase in catechol pathway
VRLVSYTTREEHARATRTAWRAGIVAGDRIVDAGRLAADNRIVDAGRPAADMGGPPAAEAGSVRGLLALGDEALAALAAAATDRAAAAADRPADRIPRDEVVLGPPVPDPEKIICIGLNYRDHAGEVAMELPPAPILFPKWPNSLIGDGQPIVLPPETSRGDYEGELAVVIGRRVRRVSEADALGAVAGYMPFNDVSGRDLQMQVSQWAAGKAIDSFAPCGPELVLAGEVGDVGALELRTRLNGETVQSASTELMIFSVAALIAYISSLITLGPGDVIATGTPAGVGFTREPPIALAAGDVVEVEIPGVGLLTNPVVAEDAR